MWWKEAGSNALRQYTYNAGVMDKMSGEYNSGTKIVFEVNILLRSHEICR